MKKIPIGIENFKELIDKGFYYVDKTRLIKDLINEKVVLYSRPRRFGKTLNMSMLYYFFSNKEKENAYLFDNLAISKDEEAKKHQNEYPVISITLKDMKNNNFDSQLYDFSSIVSYLINKNEYLLNSERLNESEKEKLKAYLIREVNINTLKEALYFITQCLYKHYGKKVIVLIDEYDVPLQSAYLHGFYDETTNFISGVFSTLLKTNDALEKGVMTGCLRIARESIFTGLNNFKVKSIFNNEASDCFGFTQKEVSQLLVNTGLEKNIQIVKDWYDGYLFGNNEIYNSWSVLMYVDEAQGDSTIFPRSYWANTSGNDIVYNYIKNSNRQLKDEFEILINGGSIKKQVSPELTYREMGDINYVYSFLLFTGYLKVKKIIDKTNNIYTLEIPNKEVEMIYKNTFNAWFRQVQDDYKNELIEQLVQGNTLSANKLLNDILQKSISYYDNIESFYHGFLVGLFNGTDYGVESNKESGDGRFDVVLFPSFILDTTVVIECKHSNSLETLESDSINAVNQIKEKKYIEGINKRGYKTVIGYGISFYKKQCIISKL